MQVLWYRDIPAIFELVTGHKQRGETMTKAKKITETELISANLMQLVLDLERQGTSRKAIMALVAPEIEAIDKKRKAVRECMEKQLKALDSCIDCVCVANALCPTVPGQDDSARKRLQRRRSTFSTMVAKCYPEWDITKEDGTLFCKHIGSATRREAISLFNVAERLTALDLPDKFTIVDIEAALEDAVDSVSIDAEDTRSYGITAEQATAIADRMNEVQERMEQAQAA